MVLLKMSLWMKGRIRVGIGSSADLVLDLGVV